MDGRDGRDGRDGQSPLEILRHELVAAQQAARHYKAVLDRRAVNGYAQVVSTLGFPVVVALILLGMFTGYVPSPMAQTATLLVKHVEQDAVRTRLLRVMCRHQAQALKQSPDECDVQENHR